MMEIKATIRFNEQFKSSKVLDRTRHSTLCTTATAAATATTHTTKITTNVLPNDAVNY
jgi:hypothetical protein